MSSPVPDVADVTRFPPDSHIRDAVADVSRSRRHRHRLEASARTRRPPHPVDCGLFQGLKELRERNWQPLPDRADADRRRRADARAPRSLRLPAAARRRRGFAAASSARPARRISARSCCRTRRTSRKRTRATPTGRATPSTSPALPLYTAEDAARALTLLQPVGYDRPVPVAPGVEVEFINAGHLLGSAYARVRLGDKTILFGGDLGRYGRPGAARSDAGRRRRRAARRSRPTAIASTQPDDDGARLAAIVNDTAARRRKLIIPVVRHRPRRGGALLAQAARGRRTHPDAAGVRRQPDGRPRAAVLRRAASTSSIPDMRPTAGAGVKCAFCTAPDDDRRLGAAVEGARRVATAGDRHRVERHGDRRARAPSSRRGAARIRGTPCCSSAIRRPGRAGAALVDGGRTRSA